MSATTTDPRIDTAPGPGVVHTPQESEEETMKEWDDVVHFDDSEDSGVPGEFFVALCGEEMVVVAEGEFNGESVPNECPICRALYDELHPPA